MVGGTLVSVAENLCEAIDLRPGQRVLDVATGSGNTALAAGRRFCDVIGIDYVPELLERAKERAVVTSTFVAMFAPDHERTAAELARVCRPGGKIGLANWTPDSFIGQLFKVTGTFVPPPPGLNGPVLWGNEDRVREYFGTSVSELSMTRRTFVFRYLSADHFVGFFRSFYGPTMKAFEALDDAKGVEYAAAILELIGRFNRSGDETMVVDSEYLEVVAVRA